MDGSAIAKANLTNGSMSEATSSESVVKATEAVYSDIENQNESPIQQPQRDPTEDPNQAEANGVSKIDENTVSTFQDTLTTSESNGCWILSDDEHAPFPSVYAPPDEHNELVNVCPCRCLFFTFKETICMVISAFGCAVFVVGLVFLCMFLEGSWFEQSQ